MRFAQFLPLVVALVGLRIASAQQPATKPAAPILENRLKPLPPETPAGPFVLLDDGAIVAVKDDSALISRDGGTNWERHALFAAGAYKVRPEYAIARKKDGAIVVVFIDDLVKQWKWDNEKNTSAVAEPILYVWSTRSTDGGKTWSSPVKVQDGYCGAVRDMIETRDGTLVVPLQKYLPEHSRHATTPFYSTDGGANWKSAGVLDIGGRGHHDGSIESTVVERRDGKLWMILRTCDDYLAQSFSSDSGKTWSEISPTTIDASSSPAIVKRLASGRLAMAWNRLYPEGKSEHPRRAGQHSAKAASWHREELSLAFSDDDGKTWTKPAVVARAPGARVSYPFLFEPRPGVVWLTTMQGGLRSRLNENEFLAADDSIWKEKLLPSRLPSDKSQPAARRDDNPPLAFAKQGTVFNVGESGAFDASWATCPTVVREGNRYRMWYSGYFTSREGEGGIGVAESADGITWQRSPAGAIFNKGAPGAFDSELVFAPEVLFDGTTYRMYYTGQSNREHASNIVTYQIGLATSSDGITWKRENAGRPILENGATDSPDEVQAATPTIVKTSDGYRMWYAAWSPKFNHTICAARSNDGINWTRENNGAPVEGLSPSIAYAPAVTKVGERYYMLYMALSATRNLYAAVSDDGLKWQMLNGGEPVIATGERGSFDSDIVGHPFLMDENGKLRAWYTGYQKAGAKLADWKLRIGLAETVNFSNNK